MTRYSEPWGILNQFYRDLNQVFGQLESRPGSDYSSVATSAWVPAVDIKEEIYQFLIEADIPGVDLNEIEVSMEAGILTIKGERKLENQMEGKDYKRVERLHGTFYRRFSLPDTADSENITATGKNGVLRITIPKKEKAQPRKIAIQS